MNNSALKEAYEKFAPLVHRQCLKYLGSKAAADDATHDVFIKLYRRNGRMNVDTALLYWLYATAAHHCIDVLRRNKHLPAASPNDLHENVIRDATSLEQQLELRDLIRRLLHPWDKKIRKVILMLYWEGRTQDEVSEITGMAPSTIRKYVTRFRRYADKKRAGQGAEQ